MSVAFLRMNECIMKIFEHKFTYSGIVYDNKTRRK